MDHVTVNETGGSETKETDWNKGNRGQSFVFTLPFYEQLHAIFI